MFTVFDGAWYRTKKSVQELAPLVAKYGIAAINPPVEILEDHKKAKEAAKCVYDNGLKWTLMPTPADFLVPDTTDEMFEEGLKKLKIWAETGEKIGVKYAYNHVFPGHNTRKYDENFEWHIIRIRQVNKIMSDHGIHYGLEFLGPWDLRNSFKYPFVHTISGGLALADAVDPSVGFIFDTFHWFTGSSDPDDMYYAAQHVNRMVNFHINDAIAGKSRTEQLDLTRAMPLTTGVIDAVLPYKLFKDHGYTGPVSCEPINPSYIRFETMAAEDVVKEIAEAYNKIEKLSKEKRL